MISVQEAKEILMANAMRGTKHNVPLIDSLGKIVAEDITSPCDVPHFDNSAMDGYAIKWNGENNFRHFDKQISGKAGPTGCSNLPAESAFRIFTGAPMPKGADTVIPQEFVTLENGLLSFDLEKFQKGSNVRYQGNQNKKGDLILKKHSSITPGTIGLLASVGISQVPVYAAPSVAIIVTGDELKEIGQDLEYGEIYNSNGPTLKSYLRLLGIEEVQEFQAPDKLESLSSLVKEVLVKFDFILFSGGISVGEYDFVKTAMKENGIEELFYKIKQRPGKPLFAGKTATQLVFALPGNPASVISCFNQYVRPTLKHYLGFEQVWEDYELLPCTNSFSKKPPLTFFLKALKSKNGVEILGGQESFNLLSFGISNAFVEIPEDCNQVNPGHILKVYNW
ncbi:molybdopterin molybdotransferase MoeA [Litoribacter alkaliphilus]|uniref:Molybdopterin molybdenumtransferase n=1 Tax=Litoribacter ruber TaxID=702568 RepID=A0AAP2CGX5_9BACT|nr:molybdopterin molybdotransferase MoeA [Litoribacter alkaliphilus]MBS9524461.1 molybdopterin molybdotransferase MoeA [Litoribacter alkaliphilus]